MGGTMLLGTALEHNHDRPLLTEPPNSVRAETRAADQRVARILAQTCPGDLRLILKFAPLANSSWTTLKMQTGTAAIYAAMPAAFLLLACHDLPATLSNPSPLHHAA
jgi:hypothetical protein